MHTSRTIPAALVLLALAATPAVAAPRAGGGATTVLVSATHHGGPSDAGSGWGSVSDDGHLVAFTSYASDIVDAPTSGWRDVYLRDLRTGSTRLISEPPRSGAADGPSGLPTLSADGRHVAFTSEATNLVRGDSNRTQDVFVRDLVSGEIERVSVADRGGQARGWSEAPSISADGRTVAFESSAANLVAGDTNGRLDVFVRDRAAGRTVRVSVATDGREANASSFDASVSADGRHVAFTSMATNLVPGDTNAVDDVFVHDLATGVTTRVNLRADGSEALGMTGGPSISADGSRIAFWSEDALIAADRNGVPDVYVLDRGTGHLRLVSTSSKGRLGNGSSYEPVITADGDLVAFTSEASNLVGGDTNGRADVFVHNLRSSVTTRASLRDDGQQVSGSAGHPALSADGRVIVFRGDEASFIAGGSISAWEFDVYARVRAP